MECPNCKSNKLGLITEGEVICGISIFESVWYCPNCGYEEYTDIYGNTEIMNDGKEVEKDE